ncbi:hypothetical protein JTE90_003183 [Oedothorax gibbosus]|uniref:Small ribosomal subunit protein uS7 domain-containing protein n=1 Tax=Oedothorax gibbosus TaxID=931172 RepID=A0AAV6UR72_9ARAC|nr:hypothetical protein JTE90_003183 [Oedothorax gibbosus]
MKITGKSRKSRDVSLVLGQDLPEEDEFLATPQGKEACEKMLNTLSNLHSRLSSLPRGVKQSVSVLSERCSQLHPSSPHSLRYMLDRSLAPNAQKKDVKRVCGVRHLLPPALPELLPLLKKCAVSPLYLSMEDGRKVLKEALTASIEHVAELHEAMREKIPDLTPAQAESYGKIYFQAWVYAAKDEKLEKLEAELKLTCVQDIIMMAITGRQRQMVANTRTILSQFHCQRKDMRVMQMLYSLYEPILWRHIKDADGVARGNASALLLDVFPLESPSATVVDNDQELNEQMLTIKALLEDEFPCVRTNTVVGLSIAINVHWELFPEDMLKTYFTVIFNELSLDSATSEVRLAVVKGLIVLLENPLTHPTLAQILPRAQHLFNDRSEHVRTAFCQLLLRVKHIHDIKYYHIVPLPLLLARLEEEGGGPVAKLLVRLVHNSYFPAGEGASAWLHRCIEMIKADRGASRVFFQHVSQHVPLEHIAQFMGRAVESLHFYVTSKRRGSTVCVLSSPSSKKNKGAPPGEEALGLHDPKVVAGLLDALAILWLANVQALEKPENKQSLKMIVSKFTKCLADLALYYKAVPEVCDSVLYLCSFMPPRSVGPLAPLCFERLQSLPPSSPLPPSAPTLVECLCAQEGDSLLTLLHSWMQEGLTAPPAVPAPPKTQPKRKKRKTNPFPQKKKNVEGERAPLALDLLGLALERRSCQKALLVTCPGTLVEILALMHTLKARVEEAREDEDVALLRKLLLTLLKVAVLLHSEDKFDGVRYVEECCHWLQQRGPPYSPLDQGMCQDLCTVMADMTLLGFINMKSMKFLKFGMNLLQSECGGWMLVPGCRLVARHVALGLSGEDKVLHMVPDAFAIIVRQATTHGGVVERLTQAEVKECQALLSSCLLQVLEAGESEVLSSLTLTLIKALLLQATPPEDWDSLKDVSLSAAGNLLLSFIGPKPKMIVHFLQHLHTHVKKTDPTSLAACIALLRTLANHKSANVVREVWNVLRCVEGELSPLRPLDTNRPTTPKDKMPPSLEERCLGECSQLRTILLNKNLLKMADTWDDPSPVPLAQELPEIKLFGKWSSSDVQVSDISLTDYIAVKEKYARYIPHSAGRFVTKRFRKAQCPIVERLTNSMMMHGRNNGKKLMACRIVKHAFEIIHLMTNENPLQVLVNAIINSGPREDSTRIGRAGTVRRQAVDVSPLRRVNQAIWLLCTGAREAAFRNIKTIAECLADELMNAAKGSSNSYAIKKKDELERVAKSNR